jgi:ABC-2 type transport system permease protein
VSNTVAIFRRELSGLFGRPLAYIALTLFILLLGFVELGLNDLLLAGRASMRDPFFWIAAWFLFLLPAVTMGLIAEERRTGTLELLVTLPVTPTQIVVAKWLAAVAFTIVALALTASYPLALCFLGELDWGPVVGGYLGLLLLGATITAIGTATSAATPHQMVAFLVAFLLCVLPWLVGFALTRFPAASTPLIQYLTFEYHFSNLSRGVIDSRSLIFYGSIIFLSLRVAVLFLQQRRLT